MPFETIIYGVIYVGWLAFVINKTRTAVLVLPFFFPLYLLRFEVFGVPVYFVEGLIIIAAIPVFVKILKGEDLIKKSLISQFFNMVRSRFSFKKNIFLDFFKSPFFPVVLFLTACIVSTLIVPDENSMRALGILKSWIIIPLIFFAIYYYTAKSVKDVTAAMHAYIASAAFLAIWALYQGLSGQFITIDARVSGPFESANYLVLYMAPALVFSAVRLVQAFLHKRIETAQYRWNVNERRIFYGTLLSLFFVVLILSQSYGGIIGVFIALFAYIIYERRKVTIDVNKKFLNRLIGFVLTFLIIAGTLTASLNIEKFQNIFKLDEHTSIATRVEIWQVGGRLILENPVLGIGLGQFEDKYTERASEILQKEPFEEKRLHSHNIFMAFWLNSGLLGFISFIWIIVLIYIYSVKHLTDENKKLMTAGIIVFTYILVHGLIDVPFWKNDLALLFWLIAGSVFVIPKTE
jgi:O-antigen ligase